MTYTLHHGDCLEVMQDIPDGSIDMVLADPPYQMIQCDWDVLIPFCNHVYIDDKVFYEQDYINYFFKCGDTASYLDLKARFDSECKNGMWEQLKRITKKNGVIALFGSQPFTTDLISSNRKWFKYELIWEKAQGTGFFNANKSFLKSHGNILIFYQKQPTYNPQKTKGKPYKIRQGKQSGAFGGGRFHHIITTNYGDRFPCSVLFFQESNSKKSHPTQKPVALLQNLILTYTLEGQTILDFCAGSHSTGIACINTKRKYIGIEKTLKYHNLGKKRLENHLPLIQMIT